MELWTAVATGLIGIVVPVFTLIFNQRAARRSITTLREVATDEKLSQTVRREAEAALVQLIGAPKLMGRGLWVMGIMYAVVGVVLVIAAFAKAFGGSGWSYGILGVFAFGMGCYLMADISAKRDAVAKDHNDRVKGALEGKTVAEAQHAELNPNIGQREQAEESPRTDGAVETRGSHERDGSPATESAPTPEV